MREKTAKTKKILNVIKGLAVWAGVLLLALPLSTCAQQDPGTQSPTSTDSSSISGDSQHNSLKPPVTTSLETGQALNGNNGALPAMRVSPVVGLMHLGHLSVLSLSTMYVYDSNATFQPSPQAASAGAAQGLALFSIGSRRTALDFQYRPYVLVSNARDQANLIANSLDLHIYRYLSPHWLLDLSDRFQYSPNQGRLADPTLSADFTTGIVSREPFLTNDLKTLMNGLSVGLTDHYSARDSLTFHGQDQYVETWQGPQSSPPSPIASSSQRQDAPGGGISWFHQIRENQQFGVIYNYDRQLMGSVAGQSQYHSLLLDYSQQIRPSVLVRLSFGPSLQIRKNGADTKTLVGTAEILKSFRASNVVLAYARDETYVGVISNSYHDRYEAYYSRNLGHRWELLAGGGYLRQSLQGMPGLTGRSAWGRVSCFMSPRVSAFVSFMNFAAEGGFQRYTSRNLLTAGLHWGYRRMEERRP